MAEEQQHDDALSAEQAQAAQARFREALLRSHRTRGFIGEMESAAAQFCRAMRLQGHPPERMLKDAKRVIEESIDGDNVPIAERAVRACIQHYYREAST